MTLPASGTISMSQVSVELSRGSTATTSLGESAVRTLAGVPSGAVSFSNLHGKSAYTPVSATKNRDPNGYVSCAYDPPYQLCGARTFSSESVTITASNGNGSYTYSWAYLSGSSFTINSPSAATTTFTSVSQTSGVRTGVYRCTVSDGTTNATVDVTVTMTYEIN